MWKEMGLGFWRKKVMAIIMPALWKCVEIQGVDGANNFVTKTKKYYSVVFFQIIQCLRLKNSVVIILQ